MENDNENIVAAAQQALKDAGGDVVEATTLMIDRVTGSDALYRLLADPLIDAACYRAVAKVCRVERRAIWVAPNYDATGQGQRLQSVTERLLMDFRLPLPGLPLLKDCGWEELERGCKFYVEQATDMAYKGRWLRAILSTLPTDKTVGEHFEEAELRKMQEMASDQN